MCLLPQRVLPIEAAQDLFFMKPPDVVADKKYNFRPYAASDEVTPSECSFDKNIYLYIYIYRFGVLRVEMIFCFWLCCK